MAKFNFNKEQRFYVYALLDLNGNPFYIGKGTLHRYLHHFYAQHQQCNQDKTSKIKDILAISGERPKIVFLHKNVDEETALFLEKEEIKKYKIFLTNKTDGGLIDEYAGQNNPASRSKMSLEKILAKNKKSGETTKKYGLLKGKNHPLFGKGHSEISKQKIKDNHADVIGANNSHARHWEITDPNGHTYNIVGELKKFCDEHHLSYSIMIRNANKGKINAVYSKTTSANNTLFWKIDRNDFFNR